MATKKPISKKEELQRDIYRLEMSIQSLEDKLMQLEKDYSSDPALYEKYIGEKMAAAQRVDQLKEQLAKEEFKERTQPSEEEQKKRREEFEKKNGAYGIARTSYITTTPLN